MLQTPSEISIKEVSARYAEFITSLSIFKVTVNNNREKKEKGEMQELLLDFRVEHTTTFLVFHMLSERSIKKIRVRYAELIYFRKLQSESLTLGFLTRN